MPLPWITINTNLQSGIQLINSITPTKFNLLLKHITEANNKAEVFSPDELNKLTETLKLTKENLQLLILSIAHIFKQASKIIVKPTVLLEQLAGELKLGPEKAELFVKAWMDTTNKDFQLEDAKKVAEVSWQLNLQSSSVLCSREKTLNARIQMKLTEVHDSSDEKSENVTLELDESELIQFYSVLENIQTKLDSIQ